MRHLDAEAIHRLWSVTEGIAAMRDALRAVSAGAAGQPVRQAVRAPGGRGLLGVMPGWTSDPGRLGAKVVTVFPREAGSTLGSHQGLFVLFDAADGAPLALLDARALTAVRTAAATAAATDLLANPDAATLGLCGSGEQAAAHLEAISAVRPIQRVLVWNRDRASADRFACTHAGRCVQVVDTPDEVFAGADIVCTLTSASRPFVGSGALRPGQHVNLVGACAPGDAEIDLSGASGIRLFVDDLANAAALSDEVKAAGVAPTEIGNAMLGEAPGRVAPSDVTVFKSLGVAAEDIHAADLLLRAAAGQPHGEPAC